jgi:Flp pilus assembly protein TadG
MTTTPLSRRLAEGQAGSVSVMAPLLILTVLVLLGLAFDGGTAISAHQRAIGLAEQAARAGAQQVSIASVRSPSGPYRLAPQAARRASDAYLRRAGATGQVRIGHDQTGDFVEVAVAWSQPAVFAGLLGLRQFNGTGTAQARLCRGIVTEEAC